MSDRSESSMTTDPRTYAAKLETLRYADGLFVGQLDDVELEAFNHLINAGLAMRAYEGASGFMGLAKVRLMPTKELILSESCKEPRRFVTIDCGEDHGPHHIDQCVTCGLLEPDLSMWACPKGLENTDNG